MNKQRFGFTLAEGATHVGTCKSNSKLAFTLAEVLITLGVIGVVAAATLPTLIGNHEKKVWAKSLAKSYSTATQACKMALAQNNTSYINLTDLYKSLNQHRPDPNVLKKYFKNANILAAGNLKRPHYSYITHPVDNANMYTHSLGYAIDFPSSTLYIKTGNVYGSPVLEFAVDVNGNRRDPNKMGADMFMFSLDYNCSYRDVGGTCANISHQQVMYGCFKKIMLDGWEMKYDPMLGTGFGGGDY